MSLLSTIQQENDIRKLPPESLTLLAEEIRTFLITSVAETGGHLASNLGTVELTIALHRCMNFPEDKLIFDVGHQSYTHKILTGRKEAFHRLRQYGGISGFPKSEESDADAFNTGHSSTSLSASLGYAEARQLRGTHEKICAVIGDGSLTGGMVYEALDQMSSLKSNLLIVLNDNEMSIAHNVGGMSMSLSRFRVGKSYNRLKNGVENRLMSIPDVGERLTRSIKSSKDRLRNLIVPNTIFDEMGITYIGPIDGHDIASMIEIFSDAFTLAHPVLVHVKTKKGKGYPLAERYPEHFHGVGPFDPATGRALQKKTAPTYTSIFSRKMVELGRKHENLVAITAAMAHGTGLRAFQREFPDRTFDVGIAEQHAVTFAAGLAKGGYLPVFAVYSSFLQRGFDQILHDVCLQHLHVIFCLDRSGIVGEDGETHQGIYDTAYLSLMPGLDVIAPKSAEELEMAMDYAVSAEDPVAIRYPKGTAAGNFPEDRHRLIRGKSEIVQFEKKVGSFPCRRTVLIAVGSMVAVSFRISQRIMRETGYQPEVVNVRFIRPLDKERILEILKKADLICVLEEAVRQGSVGEAVGYILGENLGEIRNARQGTVPEMLHFCLKDEIIPHGSREILLEKEGLGEEELYQKILKEVRRSPITE